MSFGRKKQRPSVPAPSGEASERLFEKITQELDIQPQEKRRRRNYRAEAAFLYAAPRIAALLLVMAAVLMLLATAGTPSTLKHLEQEPTEAGSRISFSVTRPMMVGSVSAILNGRSLPVGREARGYWVNVTENGRLELQIHSILGTVWAAELPVTGIDKQSPHIVRHEAEGENVRIYLTDGEDGSGIDWQAISASYTDSGQPYPVESYDEADSAVLFSIPDAAVTVLVPDLKGNVLNISIIPGGDS